MYYAFYEGKSTELVLHVMEQAYKGYMFEMSEQKQNEKGIGKEKAPESIRAKLAFFRDRVAARDRENGAVEKNRTHSEPQR